MNYTIATTEDVQGEIQVEYVKDGNEYLVGIYHKELKEYTSKRFTRKEDAQARYLKLVSCILDGTYDYKWRKRLLLD